MSNESYVKAILDGTADKEVIFDRLSDMAMDAMNSVSSIDELSKSTLGSYIKKASKTATGLATNAMHLSNAARMHDGLAKDAANSFRGSDAQYHDAKSDEYHDHSTKATEKQVKRLKGVDKAVGKLTKESEDEQIDELSKSTLGQYVRIASTDAVKHTHDSSSAFGKKTQAEKKELFKKAMKRLDGVRSASYKLAKESEELDEAVHTGPSGAKYDVVKNEKKSVGTYVNGKAREHFDIQHEGKNVGHIQTQHKLLSPGKSTRVWNATLNPGEHRQMGWPSYLENPHVDTGHKSKNAALEAFARLHKSNLNNTTKESIDESYDSRVFEPEHKDKPVVAWGVKGMDSKKFSKKFKNKDHFDKWADSESSEDHEVHGLKLHEGTDHE